MLFLRLNGVMLLGCKWTSSSIYSAIIKPYSYLPRTTAINNDKRNRKMRNTSRNLLLLSLIFLTNSGYAANHKVQMLNSGAEGYMVFEPALLTVDPGDSVTFVATDLSHNSESVEGMIPEGAVPWSGKMSEDITVIFDKAGVYVYQCTPHAMMAMVGVINVGDAKENLNSVKAAAVVKKTAFVTNKDRLDKYLLSL